MSLTLKEMLDDVLLECGHDTEVVYATATSDAVLRLVALANRSVRKLAVWPWQALRKQYTFSLTSATEYDLPSDYRAFIPDTMFADSYIHPVDLRTNPEHWAYLKSATGGTGPRYRFRILGDKINVYDPQDGETVRVEYLADHPILAANGTTTKKLFTADTDTWILDDDVLEMDLIWRYKKLLGLDDWQVDYGEFKSYLRTIQGQQAASKTIAGDDTAHSFGEPYTDLWVSNQ